MKLGYFLKVFLTIVLVILISAPVVIPLFKPYALGTADGLAHKFRTISFERSLKEGNIRPRWLGDQALGLGSPIFIFNYPLPYYIIAGIHQFNMELNSAVQIYQALTLVLSFGAMFLIVRKLWGYWAGLVAGAIYTFAPYHLLTVYVYEGWGELTAFIFPPLLIYLNLKLPEGKKGALFFLISCLTWFLFFLTHNVSLLIYVPVIFILTWAILGGEGDLGKSRIFGKLGRPLAAFFSGMLTSAFFWLPAIIYKDLTRYPILIREEMALRHIFYKPLAMQAETAVNVLKKGNVFYYDFTLGLPILTVSAIAFLFLTVLLARGIIRRMRGMRGIGGIREIRDIWVMGGKKGGNRVFVASVILLALSIYLNDPASVVIWNFRLLQMVVYPFRFMALATFLASVTAGYLLMLIKRKGFRIISAIIIIALSAALSIPHTRPYLEIFPFDDAYFSQTQWVLLIPWTKKNMATTEFLPKWANLPFLTALEEDYKTKGAKPELIVQNGYSPALKKLWKGNEYIKAEIEAKEDSEATVNIHYFPCWQVYLDGRKVETSKNFNGLISVTIPKGDHELVLRFGYLPYEITGLVLSLLGLILLLSAPVFFFRVGRVRKK